MSEIQAGDVVGHWIFNENKGQGLGKAVEQKTVSNLKGDSKEVFVCVAPDGNEVNRDVSDILDYLNKDVWGYEMYDEHPWGAEL
jgi:hypothetical protein